MMNIKLDDRAKSFFKDELNLKDNESIRLKVTGFGWSGPKLGFVLDEQRENDVVSVVDGIKFVCNKDEEFIFENTKLVYQKGIFGGTVKVITNNTSSSGC